LSTDHENPESSGNEDEVNSNIPAPDHGAYEQEDTSDGEDDRDEVQYPI
jgi:hypothetical protein